MKEAQEMHAKWEDVDEETFARFAQWMYTGNYPPPRPEPVPAQTDKPKAKSHFDIEDSNSNDSYSDKGGWGSFGQSYEPPPPPNDFDKLTYLPAQPTWQQDSCDVQTSSDVEKDYALVFLGHAHLYVLADRWGIDSLKDLVLSKLHSTLKTFVPSEQRYLDIVELAEYTYDNTPTKLKVDGLRGLICKYITYRGKKIAQSEACLSLVERCGPFAKDLMTLVLERGDF